jgi:hypothetical protein
MAEKIKIFSVNKWVQYAIVESSQHENFMAENTQNRDFGLEWRSRYGAGSGWGRFEVVASGNDRLDFEDSGTTTRVASLTPGTYDADTLAAHIETQMEAVTTDTFTVEYLESSKKFKITNGVGNFKLLWNTGANKSRSIDGTIGFSDAADDTGADNYTADFVSIHYHEYLSIDFGAASNVHGVFIRGHNISSNGVIYVQFSTDNFASISEQIQFTVQDDILTLEWDSPKNYRYMRVIIFDPTNTDGYVALGVVWAGVQFQPERTFLDGSSINRIDPSEIQISEHGQETTIQIGHFDTWPYTFQVRGVAEKTNLDAVFDTVGYSKAFFIVEDPASPLTTTKYVAINSWVWQPLSRSKNTWYLNIEMREQR